MEPTFDRISVPKQLMQVSAIQYRNLAAMDEQTGEQIAAWGETALVSGGERALQAAAAPLELALARGGVRSAPHIFKGECCRDNIAAIATRAREAGADLIIGVGGGKALDAAKAAAWAIGRPVVCIPTIAATCAAVTPLSITYTPDGVFDRALYLPSPPHLVLADSAVIAAAPGRYLASGIFDALAKWYEGRAVYQGIADPHVFTSAALRLAEVLNEEMERKAVKALRQVRGGAAGEELRQVVDLNVYLTGIIQGLGLFTLRGGAAHAIHNGLTVLPQSHRLLHGFKVAYGIVAQQLLEGKSAESIQSTIAFFRSLGFDPNLKRLGLPADPPSLRRVAVMACADEAMVKMPFPVEEKVLVSAMQQLEETTDPMPGLPEL